ncbi:MAG: hypothetical protein LQ350_004158 [Teloschistes chrysophthalmus]|nr:MAG: hypothetical protein LQ350_004158 [Niorma chrysophthalma]
MKPTPLLALLLFAATHCALVGAGCFKQGPPGTPQLSPAIFKHCIDPIKELAKLDKAHAPIAFSRKRGIGYPLPQRWFSKSCWINLDMHNADDEDFASFMDISIEAGTLAASCVAQPPHLGGTVPVGAGKVMNITILGIPLRPPPPRAIS